MVGFNPDITGSPNGRSHTLDYPPPWRKRLNQPAYQQERNSADLNLISGEPGIGKSRLARTLAEQIASKSYTPIRLQCSPFHTDRALYPFIEHFERVAGFTAYCRWAACSPSAGAQRKAGPRRIMSSSATCGQTYPRIYSI